MKTTKHFLMEDVYDYVMENDFNIGTNFRDEFPESWIDSSKGIIYLAKDEQKPLFTLKIERFKNEI